MDIYELLDEYLFFLPREWGIIFKLNVVHPKLHMKKSEINNT